MLGHDSAACLRSWWQELPRKLRGGVLPAALLAALIVAPDAPAVAPTDTLTTLAGTGTGGFNGEGQATSAQLNFPTGVGADAGGNVYVADRDNNRVRRVSPAGVISTVAGTGVAGFNGDGVQATSAQLNQPRDVAVDGAGNVYVADQNNHRVRKISPAGIITTVAGTGVAGFNGDGIQATSAQLASPRGVAVDEAGSVYISDTLNHRIRKVDPSGIITTVAGTGAAGFSGDGGQATSAQLSQPRGVDVDGAGNVYIADLGNERVRKVDPNGVITTLAGTGVGGFSGDGGQATAAQLNDPEDVAADAAGSVYISDFNNERVRKVDPNGIITTVAGTGVAGFSGDGGQAVAARLDGPVGLALDGSASLYIGDFSNHRVRKVTNVPPEAAFTATPPSGTAPLAVAFDASGSSDANGTIVSHTWDFGDGQTAAGQTVDHTYQNPEIGRAHV